METLRLRVGGHDLRKEMFKGWVEVERFSYRSSEGSFCVMKRDEVSLMNFSPFFSRAYLENWVITDRLFCVTFFSSIYFREVPFHGDNYGRV